MGDKGERERGQKSQKMGDVNNFGFSPLGTSETKRKSIEHSHDSPFRNHIAKAQLEHLDEKLQNKVQALKALQSSLKPDSKILKMLQEQVQNLQKEHLEVQQVSK